MHIHASVSENGSYVMGRQKCFTQESALDDAKNWLTSEIDDDQNLWARSIVSEIGADVTEGAFDNARHDLEEYDGRAGDWWRSVSIPNDVTGKPIETQYNLMEINEACEETMND